ncbi:glycosyltransferase family 2 protein [Vibrio sp. EJY3]|uniref:glycosyltransferase family 2 protein n=1 Tax=Vibrio sp. (strain EJY3) TaxID=1116375 RepID=UPI000243A588|nr:glycosyltransferase family 2 protein [Vibrio sp. EJY3]AEX20704.1 glycosyl transferase, group 2 family protein [Vibrio sp. EJY3]
MASKNKVYIVVLNWNSYVETIECLNSILDLDYEEFSVIVCDNGSSNDSLEHIKTFILNTVPNKFKKCFGTINYTPCSNERQFILIDNKENFGYAKGNNIGINIALKDKACEHVWILNNDTVVVKNCLTEMIRTVESEPNYGICGSRLIYYHERDKLQGFGGRYNKVTGKTSHYLEGLGSDIDIDEFEVADRIDYLIGASLLISRNFLESVNGFSEDYFLYFEELDLCHKLTSRYSKLISKNAVVYHKEGASFDKTLSGTSLYYLFQNRIRFTKKFYPLMLPTVYLYSAYLISKRLIKMDLKKTRVMLKAILFLRL